MLKKNQIKKVLLIRPPSSLGELTKTSASQHPINLLYLASYIQQEGHKVKVIDLENMKLNRRSIIRFGPDIIGITAMTPLIKKASEVCIFLNDILPKKPIFIVGGNHVTAIPKETLKEFQIFNIGVIGEGEETLKDLCEGKSLIKIPGIVYRYKNKIITNKPRPPIMNLDKIPFPARDLIDIKKYKGASTPGISRDFLNITELFINRGCNWGKCTFCASMNTHGKFRQRSIDNILREVEECIYKYGINHFTIDDDTLTTSKVRTLEFCHRIKKFGITWDCDSRVTIDKEMVKTMKESGCIKIAFGVESGSQKILNLISKGTSIKQIKNAFKYCREVGLETCAFLLIGSHPDENWSDINLTKKLIKEIKPNYITASIVTPYPGTELRKQMEERKLIFNNDWSNYGLYNLIPQWKTTNFSSKELLNIQQSLIKDFYLQPSYLFKKILKIKSFKEIKYYLKAFIGLNKAIIFKN